MKHIRKFDNYRIKKNREEIIKESVLQVNDIYKVRALVDLPQSLINAYVKKVKDNTGKNLRQFFGDVDIAEEIVKFVNLSNLDIDKLPASALMGGSQAQTQGTQTEPAPQGQAQTEPAPQSQPQAQTEGQPQAQAAPQVQTEVQPQSQPAPQGQAQPQPEEFENPQGEEENEEEEGEEENELPI